jgi:hypothetical protein
VSPANIGAVLRRASPQGRLQALRERIAALPAMDDADLQHRLDAARETAEELQAQLDAQHVPAPMKFMLRLRAAEHEVDAVLVTKNSRVQAARREGKPETLALYDDIRRHHARLVRQDHPSPTSETAVYFEVSISTVQRALRG